jgi:hypothetical protein
MNSNIVNHLHPNDGDLQRANLIATIYRHPFSGSLAPITQSDYLDSTTHPAIELGPPRQKRKLEYVKCDFCRRSKKKVSVSQYHMRPNPPILPSSPFFSHSFSPLLAQFPIPLRPTPTFPSPLCASTHRRCNLQLGALSVNPPSANGQAKNAKGVTQRDLPARRLRRRIGPILMG